MTPSQSRAARGLLGWSQTKLAEAAELSLVTVKRFETGQGAKVSDAAVEAMQEAMASTGVVFIPANGGGPGVRLRT